MNIVLYREPGRRVSYLLLGIVLAAYVIFTIPQLSSTEEWPDYDFYGPKIERYQYTDVLNGYDYHVKHALSKFSHDTLQNQKAVPFMLSISLLGATYLLGAQLGQRRTMGVLATGIVAASTIFRQFDTSAVYPNDWVLFTVLAVYFAKRRWELMPVFFGVAVLCKPLAILFVPVMLAYFISSNPQRYRRGIILGLFGAMFVSGAILMPFKGGAWVVNPEGFMVGAAAGMYFFMIPDFWLAALFPVGMFLLLVLGIKRTPHAILMLGGVSIAMFHGAFLEGFTTHWWNEPYRYIPLIVFFAVSIPVIVRGVEVRRAAKTLINNQWYH